MVDHKKINAFLHNQKKRLLEMDGASEHTDWLTEREQKGVDFVAAINEVNADDERLAGGKERIGLMEILYDNAIKWLMHPAYGGKLLWLEHFKLSQPGVISEDTTTSNIATFTTALLPAVRRIYAQLIAMDLVSVQPLSGPSGYIYWIDHEFVSAYSADGISADDRLDSVQDSDGYTDSTEQGTIREIQFRLKSKSISTESKKVAGTWTIEAEQDLRSQWRLDLEGELIPELGDLIVREINRKLVNALVSGAGAGDTEWNKNTPAADTTTEAKNAYYQTLWHAIAASNTLIANKKFKDADWLLMNFNTYYYMQRLNNFRGEPRVINQGTSISTRYVGTLNDFYRVYIDPFMADNKILMGIKGATWKDAVAYYAPYIPLFLSEKYIYNDDFTQFKQGAMTRYAYGVLPETSTQSPVKNNGLATVTLTSS